jgi:hypothetical protein
VSAEATASHVLGIPDERQGRGHRMWRTQHLQQTTRQRPPQVTYTTSRIGGKAEATTCDVRTRNMAEATICDVHDIKNQ